MQCGKLLTQPYGWKHRGNRAGSGVGEGWAGGGGTRSPLKRFCRMAVSSVPWSQKAMMIHVSSSSFSLPLDRCAVPARTARPALRRAAPRPRARPPRPPRLQQATSALPACRRNCAQLAPLWPARRRPRRPAGRAGAAPPSLNSHVRRHTDALLSSLLCTSGRWGQGRKSRGASRIHRAVCAAPAEWTEGARAVCRAALVLDCPVLDCLLEPAWRLAAACDRQRRVPRAPIMPQCVSHMAQGFSRAQEAGRAGAWARASVRPDPRAERAERGAPAGLSAGLPAHAALRGRARVDRVHLVRLHLRGAAGRVRARGI